MQATTKKDAHDAGRTAPSRELVTGNHFDKYGSRNPIHQALVGGFCAAAAECAELASPQSILEVGCGSGELATRLFGGMNVDYTGLDIEPGEVASARQALPTGTFVTGDAHSLDFDDARFDLVVACEVLEHLERPEEAVAEIARVTRGYALVSVPWEPTWRVLNCLRGKYLRSFGNTPGHIQHFSRAAIRRLVTNRFQVCLERRPFPWTMLLLEKRLSQP